MVTRPLIADRDRAHGNAAILPGSRLFSTPEKLSTLMGLVGRSSRCQAVGRFAWPTGVHHPCSGDRAREAEVGLAIQDDRARVAEHDVATVVGKEVDRAGDR